ncbi:MAG: glycosyltransferase [Ginsengibacter sp.]
MKILIVMDPGILVPPKEYGGHERLVDMFARQYTNMGHEVHLLVTRGSAVQGCTVHPFGKEGFPPKKSDAKKNILYAWKFLWKHRNDYDLIHNFGRLIYTLPVLRHPVKKIMTYGREITNRNVRMFHYLKGKNIVYTACSSNLLSRVSTEGDWKVVHNAIEFLKYTLKENISDEAPLIFLGRIEKVKGCHTAIKVAKAIGKSLIIAGNISSLSQDRIYFENEIQPYIDGEQIKYVGAVNDAQKNEYLGKAKALLFPIEWNEPFGIVMIEAMACGTPVIAYNKGSVEEVIDEGITGYKVNSFEEMISAVKRVDLIKRRECREQAKKRFNVSEIATRYLTIINEPAKKILIVTTGQPAANPRVVKEYDALVSEGYSVKVLYTYSAEWSYKIDEKDFSKSLKKQDFILIGGNPYNRKVHYFLSRTLFKILKLMVTILPFRFFKEMTIARSSLYLWIFTKNYKADVYIAHYLGALSAAVKAAKKHSAAVIFDAEDFHRGEEPYYLAQIPQVISLENEFLPKVNLITTASPLITEAYQKLYPAKKIITLNNVFSRKYVQKFKPYSNNDLKLFWFSQNIGPKRGLETIIAAMNLLDGDVSLHLLGNPRDELYVKSLVRKALNPQKIHFMDPVNPDDIFNIASTFHIGLAAEIPYCENRNICLTNKIFTYLVAGNCLLASDTEAQKDFINANPGVGLLYKHDDAHDLAKQIILLRDDRALLNEYRQNALQLTNKKLNWENESKKLIDIINLISANKY